jgi:hypothetical protein
MAEDRKRKLRRLTPREISQSIDFVFGLIALDILTGGHGRRALQSYIAWAQRSFAPADPLSPRDKSDLQEEARRYTKEAAE